jgi:hypothetical protein
MTGRNVFLYWVGKEKSLITVLRALIKQHASNGVGYDVHMITNENLHTYLIDPPPHFDELCAAHQADYVRVCAVCRFGGIWLDSDTIVMGSLDSLFDILDSKDGFFIHDHDMSIFNGVFGSKPGTELMNLWKTSIELKWPQRSDIPSIAWTTFGSEILDSVFLHNQKLFEGYQLFNGPDNLFPVSWENCKQTYISAAYKLHPLITREFQPLIILVRSVYTAWGKLPRKKQIGKCQPINYFLNKSFENIAKEFRANDRTLLAINAKHQPK